MDQILGFFLDLGSNPEALSAVTTGGAALAGVLLVWLIGRGLAASSVQSRKRHDVALHASDSLAQLFGEAASTGKPSAAACEALTLQLCSGRTLSKADMAALQGLRLQVLGPREGGAALDITKVNEHALHLGRILAGAAPNALPSAKTALKQWQDATGTKPAAPASAKKAEPAKKPEVAPVAAAAPAEKVVEKVAETV